MRAVACLLLFALPLLAAPVPASDDKPRPRAKLVGTLSVNERVDAVFWLPDGKHVLLVVGHRILVYPRDQFGTDKPKPLSVVSSPGTEVRQMSDGGLCVLAWAGTRVNAERRLSVWSTKTLLAGGEPKADRVLDLDLDRLDGARVSPDGSVEGTKWVKKAEAVAEGEDRYTVTHFHLSGKSGNVLAKTPLLDSAGGRYAVSAYDPTSGRVYVATLVNDEAVLTCRELGAAKPVWERKLPLKADKYPSDRLLVSPNGHRLAYVQSTLSAKPPERLPPNVRPGRPQQLEFESTRALHVIDAKTGERGPELCKEDTRDASAHAFSADGKLLFATISTVEETKVGCGT